MELQNFRSCHLISRFICFSCSLVPTLFLFIVVLVFGQMLKWVLPRLLQIHTNNILVHLRLKYKKTRFLCLSAVWFDVVGPRRLHSFRVNEKQMRRSLVYASWQTVSLICVSVLAWEDARRRNRRDEASPWPHLARPQQIWRNSNLIVPGWTLAWYALHAAKAASSRII